MAAMETRFRNAHKNRISEDLGIIDSKKNGRVVGSYLRKVVPREEPLFSFALGEIRQIANRYESSPKQRIEAAVAFAAIGEYGRFKENIRILLRRKDGDVQAFRTMFQSVAYLPSEVLLELAPMFERKKAYTPALYACMNVAERDDGSRFLALNKLRELAHELSGKEGRKHEDQYASALFVLGEDKKIRYMMVDSFRERSALNRLLKTGKTAEEFEAVRDALLRTEPMNMIDTMDHYISLYTHTGIMDRFVREFGDISIGFMNMGEYEIALGILEYIGGDLESNDKIYGEKDGAMVPAEKFILEILLHKIDCLFLKGETERGLLLLRSLDS